MRERQIRQRTKKDSQCMFLVVKNVRHGGNMKQSVRINKNEKWKSKSNPRLSNTNMKTLTSIPYIPHVLSSFCQTQFKELLLPCLSQHDLFHSSQSTSSTVDIQLKSKQVKLHPLVRFCSKVLNYCSPQSRNRERILMLIIFICSLHELI